MQSFEFYCPTEIVFGKGAESKAADKIKKHGGSKVFVVYGGGSVVKSGLLAKIEKELTEAGLGFKALGGVKPNPRVALAREGVKQALDFGADFVLGVGGGSVIDTAKAIAHGIANPDIDIWEFWAGRASLTKTTPVGAVLTIAAAGSETSNSAVLTNEETGKKAGINTDLNRPVFAIMNPELTYTLPPKQIACGISDIMMHTLERYFTNETGNEFTDRVAEALRACPFVVVQDVTADTDTARLAHVLLPATGWGEKDGTVTNSERRISRQRHRLARLAAQPAPPGRLGLLPRRQHSRCQIEADQRESSQFGANGTPAFFINGRDLSGAVPFEQFKQLIDDELARKGVATK